tara:strand:- start:1135 stop:3960 length:2826 start_codon:yes stop_codon:yes gene_type:complete
MNSLKQNNNLSNFKENKLSSTINRVLITFALTGFTFNALAAQNAKESKTENDFEVIEVSGSYSRSLEKAVDIKRSNIGFSDSIVATDIADFPEQNLAEALQRMPGVTIERNKGLGSKVNVRSLPSEFTHVSINDLATASGSGGRDVEFDIFASEIIQSVSVKKSPTAADEEGGIAGTVSITTARPFDYQEGKLIVSAEAAHNSISEEVDPKFSFLASEQFGDWGALVSFSSSKRTNRTDSNSGIDFRPMERWLEKSGSDSKQAQSDQTAAVLERDVGIIINDRFDRNETSRIAFLNKVGDRVFVSEQDKWGATASIQYKPDNNLSLTFDAMLGGYDSVEDGYDAAAYSASSSSALETVHAYDNTTLSEYGMTVLTDVSYANTQHEFLSLETVNKTDFSQFSLQLDWELNDWTIDGLLGYSGADKTSDFANLKHTAYGPSRTRYTATGGETILSDNPESFDMYNSPGAYNFDHYEVEYEEVSDDKYAAQLDLSKFLQLDSFPALAKVQFGVRYTDKSKERQFGKDRVQGPERGDSSWSGTRTLLDSELTSVTDIAPGGAYLSQSSNNLSWSQVSNEYARDFFRYDGFTVDFEANQFYRVDEETISLYAMADFEFEVAQLPVTLNTGVRVVDTSILSFGYHQVQNDDGSTNYTDAPISKKGSYTDVLPSINMSIELTEDVLFRAAASETLMRPALEDIAYKRSVSIHEFKYRDGNPDLQPTYAQQWELGVEWYLESGGILAASYFNKEIEGVVRETLTGVVEDVTKYNDDGSIDGVFDFDVFQKVNAEGSYSVSGIELVAQFSLGILHQSLEDFGVNTNYTMLDNSLTGDSDIDIPTPPVGLADKTFNATFYYENDTFDARISYNYKDSYVEYIYSDLYPVYRDGYGQTDISLGYKVTDDIKISLKGINLTDEATTGYTINPAFPTMNEYSGRRISLSARATF